jgi:hypothetical protein
MLRIGHRMSRVAVCLTGLGQQYEWSRICCLQAESKVQENERVDVERRKNEDTEEYPNSNDGGLGYEKCWCAKKAGEGFCLQGKPVVAKNRL